MNETKDCYGFPPGAKKKKKDNGLSVYIAGPITGMPDDNITAFYDAAAHLANAGYNVFNPIDICRHIRREHFKTDLDFWSACMRENDRFLSQAEVIYLLKGWQHSRGARAELRKAIDEYKEILISERF